MNSGNAYTQAETLFLDQIAEMITTREQMEYISPLIAKNFERTIGGIQKQIETRKGWHFKETVK